jgi:excisionase family DNA binding protein
MRPESRSFFDPPAPPPIRLLLKDSEAARQLSVCKRTLWAMAFQRGELPAVKIGAAVRYDPADLHAYLGLPTAPIIGPLLLRPGETATALALSFGTVWTLTKHGDLPALRIGKKSVRYRLADLLAFIQAHKVGPADLAFIDGEKAGVP